MSVKQGFALIILLAAVGFLCWLCGATNSAHLVNGVIDWIRTFGSDVNVKPGR